MVDFLTDLAGSSNYNGFGAARAGVGEWSQGSYADKEIQRLGKGWTAAAGFIPDSNDGPEKAFRELTKEESTIEVAFSTDRLVDMLRKRLPDQDIPDLEPSYLNFRSEWSQLSRPGSARDTYVVWTPILTISSEPFVSEELGPAQLDVPDTLTWQSGKSAGELLERAMFEQVLPMFRRVKHTYDVGDAIVEFNGEKLFPPVFYLARTHSRCSSDELKQPSMRSQVEDLAAEVLRSGRYNDPTVDRGEIDEWLLGFRREFGTRTYYLFVGSSPDGSPRSTVSAFRRIVDELSFVETSIGFAGSKLVEAINSKVPLLSVWQASLNAAVRVDRELQDHLGLSRLGRRKRRRVVEALDILRSSYARLGSTIEADLRDIEDLQTAYRDRLEHIYTRARSRVWVSDLDGPGPVLSKFEHLSVVRHSNEAVESVAGMAANVRAGTSDLVASWSTTVESERRGAEVSQARHDRRVGIGLAGLTLVTAMPLIIGESSWPELQEQLEQWPASVSWLASVIRAAHIPLTVAAAALSLVLIAFLLTALVLSASRVISPNASFYDGTGEQVMRFRHLNEVVAQRIASSDTGAAQRSDHKCAEAVVAVLRLATRDLRDLRRLEVTANRSDRLIVEARVLVISIELLDKRPRVIAGQLTASLLRYSSALFGVEPVVSEVELRDVLRRWREDPDTPMEELESARDQFEKLAHRPDVLLRRLQEILR